tara:strand:+ start:381 stop:527 length:147 start_codon:yes stop_codon:yes gene_type:complete
MQPPKICEEYNTSSKNMISHMIENNGVRNIIIPAAVTEIFLKAKIHKR